MQLNVKFLVINEEKSGVGRATGLPWRVMNVVVGWDEPTADPNYTRQQRLQCKLHGDQIDRLRALNPVLHETLVPVEIGFTTELANNYVRNDVTLWLLQ